MKINKIKIFLTAIAVCCATQTSGMQKSNQYLQAFLDAFLDREIQCRDNSLNTLLIKNFVTHLHGGNEDLPEIVSDAISALLRILPEARKSNAQELITCLSIIIKNLPRAYVVENNNFIQWIDEAKAFEYKQKGRETHMSLVAQCLIELENSIAKNLLGEL